MATSAAMTLYLGLYQSLGGSSSGFKELIASLPTELVATLGITDISTGSGYAQSYFFGLLGFVLYSIIGVSWGTAALGADEERGTLELTLAHGVSRTQLLSERAVSLAVRLLFLGVVIVVMLLILNQSSQLELEVGNMVAVTCALLGLSFLAASTAILFGACTGRRSLSLIGGSGVVVLGYVFHAVGAQSDSLSFLNVISPYTWAYENAPLTNGFDLGGLALVYSLGLVFLVVGGIVFNRRDIGS